MARGLIALVGLLAVGAVAHAQAFPEPRTVKINDRVYVLLGPIQHANRATQGYMIEIRKSLDLSNWEKLERSYVIGRNINRAYLEVEADSFDE